MSGIDVHRIDGSHPVVVMLGKQRTELTRAEADSLHDQLTRVLVEMAEARVIEVLPTESGMTELDLALLYARPEGDAQ